MRSNPKYYLREGLDRNGVRLTPQELDFIHDNYGMGRKDINPSELVSRLVGKMNSWRTQAVEYLFRRLDKQRTEKINTQELLHRFKPDRHPDVLARKTTPSEVKSSLQNILGTYGRLGVKFTVTIGY